MRHARGPKRQTIAGVIPRTRHDWEHGPPYYRRKHGIVMMTMAVMGFIGVVMSQYIGIAGSRGSALSYMAVMGWLMLTVIVMAVSLRRLRRRLRRELGASGGRLCTHCIYNLKDLPPRGSCPECGHEYDAEFDARTWWGAGFEVPEGNASPPSAPTS